MCRRLSKRTVVRGWDRLMERLLEERESGLPNDAAVVQRRRKRQHPWAGRSILDLPMRVVILSDRRSAISKGKLKES